MILVISRFGFEGCIWVLIASVPDLCTVLDFVILVISRFGFEGCIWVLITSAPDLCIFLTFSYSVNRNPIPISVSSNRKRLKNSTNADQKCS